MWRNSLNVLSKATFQQFLLKSVCQKEQIRTTFILKRKYAPLLSKKGSPPKKLKARQHIYELVKDTKLEKRPNIDVILTSFVDGLGNIGEKVSVKPQYGYNHLILPGLAVYATSENEEKYKKYALRDDQVKYSSPNALLMIHALQRMCLSVIMNREHVWTLKPWHIKVSFRKCGYVVPEDAITLPEKHIKGPDMNLENKEFYVTVTINKSEKVNVRCILHHWSTDLVNRIPHIDKFWELPLEPMYAEFKDVLSEIPKKSNNVNNNTI